jgi:myotubularin-related protein 1/2
VQFEVVDHAGGATHVAKLLQQLRPTTTAKVAAFALAFGQDGKALAATEPVDQAGWSILNMSDELQRVSRGSEAWRFTDLNRDYALCDSYPAVLMVPTNVSDAEVVKCSKFRSSRRLPALSWVHPTHGSAIVRCSQPLGGIKGRRCLEDVKVLTSCRAPNTALLYILDARPRVNIVANQAVGKGVEDASHYPGAIIELLDIPNIHGVREAYLKMCRIGVAMDGSSTVEAATSFSVSLADGVNHSKHTHLFKHRMTPAQNVESATTSSPWLSTVDGSKWLDQVRLVMRGGLRVVDLVDGTGHTVVSHCSDGWDRTSQVVSLGMLCMDPVYRTLRGFAMLVEKEWLAFGHKFSQRTGTGEFSDDADNQSPVFIQWLDCVHQILLQEPFAFEFNQHFLVDVAHLVYSGRTGTFLGNNERVRKRELKAHLRTHSAWSLLGAAAEAGKAPQRYVNPFYRPVVVAVRFSASPRHLQPWNSFFKNAVAPSYDIVHDASAARAAERARAQQPVDTDAEPDLVRIEARYAQALREEREKVTVEREQAAMLKDMIRSLDEENAKLREAVAK